MKISELITETDGMNDRARVKQERQQRLKAEVEAGMMPVIHNASGVSDDTVNTMGDLEDLGWMTKTYTHDNMGEVDGWDRKYYGPKPVKVDTTGAKELRILKPGGMV